MLSCRILNARSSKAEEPAELEKIDMWADVDANFEIVSMQAWNNVISQVCTCLCVCACWFALFVLKHGLDSLHSSGPS